MTTFPFELVSPERILYSGDVTAVVLPAVNGEMTVMAGHEPLMVVLKAGFLVIAEKEGKGRRLLVSTGFADINEKGVTVLAERAHTNEEINSDLLDSEVEHAETAFEMAQGDDERRFAEENLARLQDIRAALKL